MQHDAFWLDLNINFIGVELGREIAARIEMAGSIQMETRCREFRRSMARRYGAIVPPIRFVEAKSVSVFGFSISILDIEVYRASLGGEAYRKPLPHIFTELQKVCRVYAPRIPTRAQIRAMHRRMQSIGKILVPSGFKDTTVSRRKSPKK